MRLKHEFEGRVDVRNIASNRVMEKCGMIYEGTRKDDLYYHDRYWDVMYYYLLNNN